ncbi:MAG: hypothetical protein QOG13_2451 [Sphingomonadales bacterium]|jgi:hypothetical protein|nr:hypothetical protein [Sphingomonadales bacterium]
MIFEARWSRPRFYLLGLFCLVFAGVGLWVSGMFGGAGLKEVYPKAGWAIAILSFGAAAIFARRLWIDDVQLRIDGRGVEWARLTRPIPWSQISGAGVVVVRNHALLCITLKDAAEYPLASPVARALSIVDQSIGFGVMGLNVISLDRSFDEMVAAIRSWRPDLFEQTDRL